MLSVPRAPLVITGAGLSAESGLATFRGVGGILTDRPDLERVLSADGWRTDPRAAWEFIDQLRVQVTAAKPSLAHEILARWESEHRFDRFLIATQNIDGLHQMAGSQDVTELHGNIWQFASPRQVDYNEDEAFSDEFRDFLGGTDRESLLRKWSEENGQQVWTNRDVPFEQVPPDPDPLIRPNILLYDEPYGNRLLWVEDFIDRRPDTVLVIGCSGGVSVLFRLLNRCRTVNPACQIININPGESCIPGGHVHLRMRAGDALAMLDADWHVSP